MPADPDRAGNTSIAESEQEEGVAGEDQSGSFDQLTIALRGS